MNPLLLYLLATNVVAFLAYAIALPISARNPNPGGMVTASLTMGILPIAGGAAGALLALLVLGGCGHGRRMNKENVAWWFLAIGCLVAWGLVMAARLGMITLDTSAQVLFSGWDLGRLRVLGTYLAAINVIAFIAFAWDKHVAQSGNDREKRTPEARLFGICLIGGSAGGVLAVHLLRHKTRKWYFVWGLPFFIALHVFVVAYAHMGGLI